MLELDKLSVKTSDDQAEMGIGNCMHATAFAVSTCSIKIYNLVKYCTRAKPIHIAGLNDATCENNSPSLPPDANAGAVFELLHTNWL